jgi:hypothetical protein
MNRIKKFEAFNHRIPHAVSDVEYRNKLDTHGKEPYTQKELDFFEKIKKENTDKIYSLDFGMPGKTNAVYLQLYPSGEDDSLIEIDITKLKDDWYLIYEPGIDKFICDEWDEVLGYLGSQTNLRF